jgi:thiol:disulfide interchange protein DsbC
MRTWVIWLALLPVLTTGLTSRAYGADYGALIEKLAASLPVLEGASAVATPVPGIVEIRYKGGVTYASEDGKFLFGGPLIDVETRENLTENVQRDERARTLGDMDEANMIVFEPKGAATHTITTFTDIDCGYCRKMHREIDALNEAGVRVRYMMFPRSGLGSDSHRKAVAVWCAADRPSALTDAKAGTDPGGATCENPIEAQMTAAKRMGLRGTPFTITASGDAIFGYLPAGTLVKRLDEAGS